ncbi:MAG: HD-GYP domain-containing protein [Lachnospiraceae bacterium]
MILCKIEDLKELDVLAKDIITSDFNVLLAEGTVIKKEYIVKIIKAGINEVYIKKNTENMDDLELLKSDIKEKCINAVKEVVQKHTYNSNNDMQQISSTAHEIMNEILDEKEVVEAIFEIKERSADIYEHGINVCSLATLIGIKIGLSKERIHDMGIGCLLHDMGLRYITVDFQDVNLSSLEESDIEEYRKHTVYAYTAIKNETWLSKVSKEIVLCHHENIDGTGYPLHAKELPQEIKIMSVCDTFDEAICGIGCVKMKVYEAIEYMKSLKGNKLDAELVDFLLKFIAVFPSNSIVITNKNETGIIIGQNKGFPERPIIKIISDASGNPVDDNNIIDLLKNNDIFIETVIN